MCGIVGYTGQRPALDLLLEGLAQLEYRGYDSTGLCLADGAGFQRLRAADNLTALRAEVARADLRSSTSGLGHTRWATHGEVCVANAHPFLGCAEGPYAVVLNGIVENFAALRDELLARDHHFESATDAEVVVHLLEEHDALTLDEALAHVARRLTGHFAIVAMDRRRPNVLAGVRRQVPLIVALGDGEQFLCSSIDAMLAHTQRFVILDDDDTVRLDGQTIRRRRGDGVLADPEVTVVDRPAEKRSHEGYDSFMMKEIFEQPRAVARSLRGRIDAERVRFAELPTEPATSIGEFLARERRFRRLVIVGCGTALHAGLVARPMFQRWARIPTEVAIASEWRHEELLLDERSLVLAVSQSGETADTLEAVRVARSLGATVVGLSNVPDSQLTREVDHCVLTRAGVEVSVAATKTFTAQVSVLALLALAVAQARGTFDPLEVEGIVMELELLPEKIAIELSRGADVERVAAAIADAPFLVYLGRGAGVAVAMEGALKMREIAYVPSEVYPAGELKHGAIALVQPGTTVIAVVTDATSPHVTMSSLHEVRSRGARVIAVATEGNTTIQDVADEVLWVPATHPDLEAIVSIIPLQRLALEVALTRGHNVDQPRNLAKTVTVR